MIILKKFKYHFSIFIFIICSIEYSLSMSTANEAIIRHVKRTHKMLQGMSFFLKEGNMLKLKLGKTELQSRVILAPMAGVTDLPFRKIVREFGNFLMFSEMIASEAMIRHVKRTHKMLEGTDDEFTSIQIVGADPKVMAEAAKLCEDLGARFLDINMGCPVKKIVKSDAGSALMKNEKLAQEIMESIVNSVKIPVTLKTRLGWDMDHQNAQTIAKIAESSGIQMITIHGRTRSQLYSGKANWGSVQKVKDAVKIPVIINGDIVDIETAKQALAESGGDGVMIGRGALGQPWLLSQIHDFIESGEIHLVPQNKFDIANRHFKYLFDFYEEGTAIKLSRKVLMHYCHGTYNAAKYRTQINSISEKTQVFEILSEFLNSPQFATIDLDLIQKGGV